MSSKLILLRHGKSVWNAKNIFTGWVDVDLHDEGIKEAKKSADLLKNANIKPTICFTSYLKRAQHTLEILLKDLIILLKIWMNRVKKKITITIIII